MKFKFNGCCAGRMPIRAESSASRQFYLMVSNSMILPVGSVVTSPEDQSKIIGD